MVLTSDATPEKSPVIRKERADEADKFPVGTKVEVIKGTHKGAVGEVVGHTKYRTHSRVIVQVGPSQISVGPRLIEKTVA